MSDCIFCKIAKGEISTEKIFQSGKVIAFKDIHPQAKTHLLFIHQEHTKNIVEMVQNKEQLAELFLAIASFVKQKGLEEKGFRLQVNTGAAAGQTVFHTHVHLLSNRELA